MTLHIQVIERKCDGSEEGRGICEFVCIPGPGDHIFVTRSSFTDRMRVLAIKHYPLALSENVRTYFTKEPRINLLAELIDSKTC